MSEAERAAGVVAVSGGNHGIALAVMAAALDVKATVVMPRSAPARAVEIAQTAGASVRLTDAMDGAFALVERLREEGLTLVHPFDDPLVVAGQGTVGLEFAADARRPHGRAGQHRRRRADRRRRGGPARPAAGVRIWGVETEGAQAMSQALAAGGPVPVALSSIVTTLSAPSVSQLTYDHCPRAGHRGAGGPDREAVRGCLDLAEHAKVWTEPAAGCLLPAARQGRRAGRRQDVRLGLVVCGGNATAADMRALDGPVRAALSRFAGKREIPAAASPIRNGPRPGRSFSGRPRRSARLVYRGLHSQDGTGAARTEARQFPFLAHLLDRPAAFLNERQESRRVAVPIERTPSRRSYHWER